MLVQEDIGSLLQARPGVNGDDSELKSSAASTELAPADFMKQIPQLKLLAENYTMKELPEANKAALRGLKEVIGANKASLHTTHTEDVEELAAVASAANECLTEAKVEYVRQ